MARTFGPMMTSCFAWLMLLLAPVSMVHAQDTDGKLTARAGWVILPARHKFDDLVVRLEKAVSEAGMNVVNVASASDGARAQGISIPGNRVIGVYRNDFARRMLAASLQAGIEAPIRYYLTENPDGTATLSYRTPTSVFAPYLAGAGADLGRVAGELDVIFEAIARNATAD